MKLSAEFLILFVATIAIAGFVAGQLVPMIAQQVQAAEALVSGVSLYSNKLIFVNVRNTGSVEITKVNATIYPKGSTMDLDSVSWSSQSNPPTMSPIPPGAERTLQGTLASPPTAGQQYLVVVTVTFATGATKSYPVTVVCLSG